MLFLQIWFLQNYPAYKYFTKNRRVPNFSLCSTSLQFILIRQCFPRTQSKLPVEQVCDNNYTTFQWSCFSTPKVLEGWFWKEQKRRKAQQLRDRKTLVYTFCDYCMYAGGLLQANLRQQILDELDEVMNGDDGEEEAYHPLGAGEWWVDGWVNTWMMLSLSVKIQSDNAVNSHGTSHDIDPMGKPLSLYQYTYLCVCDSDCMCGECEWVRKVNRRLQCVTLCVWVCVCVYVWVCAVTVCVLDSHDRCRYSLSDWLSARASSSPLVELLFLLRESLLLSAAGILNVFPTKQYDWSNNKDTATKPQTKTAYYHYIRCQKVISVHYSYTHTL